MGSVLGSGSKRNGWEKTGEGEEGGYKREREQRIKRSRNYPEERKGTEKWVY